MSDNKNSTSIIDHARVEAAARDIRAHAADFNVEQECQAVIEAFDREIKEGTDATDPGIWEEPRANLVRWLSIIQQKVSEVGDGMRDDAQWLEDFSRKAREIQANAADQAQSLGSDLGDLGIGGSPTPSKPSTFDPRTFRDVTPGIAVPTVPTVPIPSAPAAPDNTTPQGPTGPTGNTGEVAPPTAPKTTNTAEATPPSAPTPAPQSNAEEVVPTPAPPGGGNAVET